MPRKKFELPKDHPVRNVDLDDEVWEDSIPLNERGGIREPGQIRHPATRSADLTRISALLLQGSTPEEIANELSMNIKMVKQDLMHLNRMWIKQVSEDQESFRAIMLQKLMKLEALALESFVESKERTITDNSHGPEGPRRSVKVFQTAGDAAFLNVAKDCIKQQVSVLGLDNVQSGTKVFDKEAFLDAVAEKIAEAKLASTSVPAMAQELKEAETQAEQAGCPF
jgi:hypothetical protein